MTHHTDAMEWAEAAGWAEWVKSYLNGQGWVSEERLSGQGLADAIAWAEAYLATPEAEEAQARWDRIQRSK